MSLTTLSALVLIVSLVLIAPAMAFVPGGATQGEGGV